MHGCQIVGFLGAHMIVGGGLLGVGRPLFSHDGLELTSETLVRSCLNLVGTFDRAELRDYFSKSHDSDSMGSP